MRMGTIGLAAMFAAGMGSAADATVVISIQNIGANVEMSVQGTFDFTGLTPVGVAPKGVNSFVTSGTGRLSSGPSGNLFSYSGLSGPTSFGSGVRRDANSSTGSRFELFADVGQIKLASNVLGQQISSLTIFNNRSLATLGFTTGSYVFRAPNDTVRVFIGTPVTGAVPEPASWAMLIAGFGLVGAASRRRRALA